MNAIFPHSARSKLAERKGSSNLVTRYFQWNKFMDKARNPKPEIRKKSEGRSPKGASSAAPARAPARTRTEIAVRSGATAEGGPTRISDFGLLSDLGFRPLDFPQTVSPFRALFSEPSLPIRRLRRVLATGFQTNTTSRLSSRPRGRRRIRRCSVGRDASAGRPSLDHPTAWR